MTNKQILIFTYDGRAVAQARPRFSAWNGYVKAVDPLKNKSFKEAVGAMALAEMKRQHVERMTGNVCVQLHFIFSPPKSWSVKKQKKAVDNHIAYTVKPDIDNLIKGVLDGLNGIAYEDDKQITCIQAQKSYGETDKIIIIIQEAEE